MQKVWRRKLFKKKLTKEKRYGKYEIKGKHVIVYKRSRSMYKFKYKIKNQKII